MAHYHHHHHDHAHPAVAESTKRIYIICIALNLGFVLIEGIVGLINNSYGLVSDAGHNLSDVLSLVLALIAFYLASPKMNGRHDKLSRNISFFNAVLLIVAVAVIAVGAIGKLIHPETVNGDVISITAGIGITVNGLTAWLLLRQNQEDLNNRGAYLHMLADTLVSVGVVLSGIVIRFTGRSIVDPLISLAIAAVIFVCGLKLLLQYSR